MSIYYYVPGTVPGAEDTLESKTDKMHVLLETNLEE